MAASGHLLGGGFFALKKNIHKSSPGPLLFLVYYGIIKFTDWMDKKKIKKAVPLTPEEFKDGNEHDVKLKKDGLNLILFVDD